MNIPIIYQDHSLLVIDKPAGIIVHPHPFNKNNNTIAEWFAKKYPSIKKYPWPYPERPGICHRLDQNTSGLLILAKNNEVLKKIQDQFRHHQIKKTYLALVVGQINPPRGQIESWIGRHHKKTKQTSQSINLPKEKLKFALTQYKTIKSYNFQNQPLSLIEVYPITGRMHQIRVHLNSLGSPVLGDQIYANKQSKKISKALVISRQFLHAGQLKFQHPLTQQKLIFKANLPDDLKKILNQLKAN